MVFQSFNLFAHMTALENVIEAPVRVQEGARPRPPSTRRAARAGRPRRQGRRLSRPALRRPAAAGGDRPGAGHGPEADAVRRADLGARPGARRRRARRHARARERRHDDDRRHARDRLRPRGRRHARVHGRRRRRRDRAAGARCSPTRGTSGPERSSRRCSEPLGDASCAKWNEARGTGGRPEPPSRRERQPRFVPWASNDVRKTSPFPAWVWVSVLPSVNPDAQIVAAPRREEHVALGERVGAVALGRAELPRPRRASGRGRT